MADPIAPAAAAQPETPAQQPVTAEKAAIASRDFTKFQDAADAQRRGKPLPDVAPVAAEEVETEPVADTSPVGKPGEMPAPQLTRRQRDQKDANERTRKAVEAATADLRAEIAALRGSQPKEAAKQEAPVPQIPDWKRYASMPDAPKLNAVDEKGEPVFSSLEEHQAAMSLFIMDKKAAEDRHADYAGQRGRLLYERSQKFGTKIQAAAAADPEFVKSIPPALRDAVPLSSLRPGEPITFANVAAEVVQESDAPDVLLRYLHAHPDDVKQIANQPPQYWQSSLARLDGRLAGSTPAPVATVEDADAEPEPDTISKAPAPAPVITKAGHTADPLQSALKTRDFSKAQAIWDQERIAKRTRAS